LTLVCIALIVLIFLLVKQKEEITKLRNGLAETFERLSHIQSLLEDLKKNPATDTIESASPPPLPVEPPVFTVEVDVAESSDTAPIDAPTAHVQRLSWFKRFKRNNPDIEKFIGENLINKIGII